MSNLHDQLDADYAPAWRPDVGDTIVGIVTDLSEREGSYGRYPIVTLRTGDEEFAVHAFHEVLQSELSSIAPKPGDEIGIKYLGKDEDRGYHRYRVRRTGDETVQWSRYSREDSSVRDDDAPPF